MTGPLPTNPPDWDAIARVLAGEATADEHARVTAWLNANPAERRFLEQVAESGVQEPAAADVVDVEAALARAHARMDAPARPALRLERGSAPVASRTRTYATLGAIAAAAAAVFVFAASRAMERNRAPSVLRITTGVGQRDSVRLADGSRVILGPKSSLEYSSTYDQRDRALTLTGEAYFDVRHDAGKPFSVRVGSAVIEDIGTVFTVESEPATGGRSGEHPDVRVAVVAGSVRLRPSNDVRADSNSDSSNAGVLLAAGDRAVLSATGRAQVERSVVADEDTAWVAGRLAFRDAPASRVAASLGRWYGVDVRLGDSTLAARRVTTSFEGESVDQALNILALTLGATVTRQGDTATLSTPPAAPTSR